MLGDETMRVVIVGGVLGHCCDDPGKARTGQENDDGEGQADDGGAVFLPADGIILG